jgi:peptidyl-prolyl cis-trans isomerase SurA
VKGWLLAFLMLVMVVGGRPAWAQQDLQRIAAVVNDQVISVYDLTNRERLVIMSSGLQDTPDVRQRLAQPVMRSLIDETLELQEAKRLNISVTTKEIENAIARIAKQNEMTPQQFQDFLKNSDIPLSTVVDQVRAGLAWHKIIAQKIRPAIEIGDDQVTDYLNRLKQAEGKPQYRVQEIFLAVDSPQQDADVKRTAERLAEQIRRGANFTALARQFSQSATAAVGGDMGWVEQGTLDPALEKVVERLPLGQVSGPVRTIAGYHLLVVHDKREGASSTTESTELKLEHFFLAAPANAKPEDIAALRSVAQSVSETATSCADFAKLRSEIPDAKTVLPENVAAKDLAPALREVALKLKVGQASEPITLNNGVFVMMVCDRGGDTNLPTAEQVRERLGMEKLDLLMRRYLRDMRQAAFVDIRA